MKLTNPAGKAAQCRALEMVGDDGRTLFFSYETLIGLETAGGKKYRREREDAPIWGPTTGRHINACGLKNAKIVSAEELETMADGTSGACRQVREDPTKAGHELTDRLPKVGGPSPWGKIQHVEGFGTSGAVFVGTAGHGGFFVPAEVLPRLSAFAQKFAAEWSHGWGPQWFEEDSAAQFVIAAKLDGAPEIPKKALLMAASYTARKEAEGLDPFCEE